MPLPPKPLLTRPERPARPERPVLDRPTKLAFKPIRPRPELEAFKAAPDPIDEGAYPGDMEGDAKAELSQLEQGFRDRLKAEADRKSGATESSYYFVVALETGDQADALLRGLGVDPGKSDLFIDGRMIADRLGIALPPGGVKLNPGGKVDPKLARLVRTP